MEKLIESGKSVLEFLEEKIMEWELDRGEDKIEHQRKMSEINKVVENIKANHCAPCDE
jgi:hypothetical protein